MIYLFVFASTAKFYLPCADMSSLADPVRYEQMESALLTHVECCLFDYVNIMENTHCSLISWIVEVRKPNIF